MTSPAKSSLFSHVKESKKQDKTKPMSQSKSGKLDAFIDERKTDNGS
jgi:hypothetical protein